ncbi:MAG: S41 family peptidase [Chloroflexi bacterium]|nr:S41 family peptidase [Chloroflexota bacterium]
MKLKSDLEPKLASRPEVTSGQLTPPPAGRYLSTAERIALAVLVVMLMVGSFAGGLYAAPHVRARVMPVSTPGAGVRDQFEIFWQAWHLVEANYVDRQAVNPRTMTYGAIRGMLDSLDDDGHTRFLTPEDLRLEESSLNGRFEGIGAEVTQRAGRPVIVAPLEGSPAERAGIRPGDTIVQVDGADVSDLTLTELVTRIRGPRGTSVRITVQRRPGQPGDPVDRAPLEVSIVRDEIRVAAVSWSLVPGTAFAHVRIGQFSQTVDSELEQTLREARRAGAEGIILDLRNNPGGLLEGAIAVTSEFVRSGNVLLQEDKEGNRRAFPVKGNGVATDLPVAILVNEGTASASEIVAGAIQDHRRGTVIGQKTFGTGTVLSQLPLNDGSALLLGTAQWLTPNGRVIWKHGIAPDITIPVAAEGELITPRQLRQMTTEEVRASGDAQFSEAVKVLRLYREMPVGVGRGGGRGTRTPVGAF